MPSPIPLHHPLSIKFKNKYKEGDFLSLCSLHCLDKLLAEQSYPMLTNLEGSQGIILSFQQGFLGGW